MSVFTKAELEYLSQQPLMRFATASPDGRPDVAAVVFQVDGDAIVTSGFNIGKTIRYRNAQSNPRASVVIDDIASMNPWTPRGIKVFGTLSIETEAGSERFRIQPEKIVSWGINDPKPGIPTMEVRRIS